MDIVTTAIAHIAHLVDGLSATLNIPLPHPLYPFEATDCLVSAQQDLWARAQVKECCVSLCPATLVNDRSAYRGFDWTTLRELPSVPVDAKLPHGESHHTHHNNARGSAASFEPVAVVNTGIHGEVREYAVNASFPSALVLLQADVVALCLAAGLEGEHLWPAEAMLLNLHLLQTHCEQRVQQSAALLAGRDSNSNSNSSRVPLLLGDDHASPAGQLHRRQVLQSIQDRYGTAAAAERQNISSSSESVYLVGDGGGPPARADFSPEKSGLAREEEWDIIHMKR